MAELFSPLTIGGRTLPNRIVLAPTPTGLAVGGGFAPADLALFYARCARGGVGLLISEPLLVTAPPEARPHLGIYDDAFVPSLAPLVRAVAAHGARLLFTLDAPVAPVGDSTLAPLGEAFLLAAWRAHAAGADGICFTAADGSLLHQLISPLYNRRDDAYGGSLENRLRFARELVEEVRRWVGRRLLIGFRLLADELTPGGLNLQDARIAAKRLTAVGVQLLDIAAPAAGPQVARFPGWAIPLANSIKRITDVPVIGSGQLSDPLLADSVVRDGSVDLVMLGTALRADPDWPRRARERLAQKQKG